LRHDRRIPPLAHAQPFILTQLTNTTSGNNVEPALNAVGTRIAFSSTGDLTPGAPGNTDGNTEIFLASIAAATLTNLSTRALVQTDANVMIAGLTIAGDTAKRVLLRGLGPTLGLPPFNVQGALADPVLTLFSGQTAIAQSDTWLALDPLCLPPIQLCEGPAAITATGLVPPQPQEAALLVTLPAGAYTAILSGAGATTGVGLVDVFMVTNP
jgi:hypothetical protein